MEELQIINYKEIPVVTTNQVAEFYKANKKQISQGFNNNKKKFTEGKHYFKITGEELKLFRENQIICNHQNNEYKNLQSAQNGLQISNKTRVLYLWTEKGTLLLAKIIDTDIAWEAYERLVDFYFRQKEAQVEQVVEQEPEVPLLEEKPKVPLVKSWYGRNNGRIKRLMEADRKTRQFVYHQILSRVGEKYDLKEASRLYEQATGHKAEYQMDLIEYFPELAEEADKYLDRIENRFFPR